MKRTKNIPVSKTPSKVKLHRMVEDSVKVFCRIKLSDCDENSSRCLDLLSPTTVSVKSPETVVNFKTVAPKETHYMFKHVLPETATQKEVFDIIGLPLVDGLVHGKNGLLFAYGATGCGKTYTLTGGTNEGGIMPRCLGAIFNTVGKYQARKYIFKQDKLNGFDIQSENEALIDRQEDICKEIVTERAPKTHQKVNGKETIDQQFSDIPALKCVREDHLYAVFVSYIEIYNNSVFDLLEDGETTLYRAPQSRVIREDAHHNMYIHLVTELEVKSATEALIVFQKGQKRKRMIHTTLNVDSSRSHTVFNIRLVQCPVDDNGEGPVQDSNMIHVSQLSLVDLASIERTSRTKNTGQRLQETGNINNSLLTLGTCLEVLRQNQMSSGIKKKVPYRDSKLTLLFKNYFEGEGQVNMVVCVSPLAKYYDQTVQVLKFSEMTQEVRVTHPSSTLHTNKFTAGRKVANQVFREALRELDLNHNMRMNVTYSSLSPPFPNLELDRSQNSTLLADLILFLQLREARRKNLHSQLVKTQNEVREHLLEVERNNIFITQENSTINLDLQSERERNVSLKYKLMEYENVAASLQRAMSDKEKCISSLDRQIQEKNMKLRKVSMEKEQIEKYFNDKFLLEKERLSMQMHIELREKNFMMKNKIKQNNMKLKQMKDILLEDTPCKFQSAVPSTTDTDTDDCVPPRTNALSSVQIPGNGKSDMCRPPHTSTPRSMLSKHVPENSSGANHNVVPSQILRQQEGRVVSSRRSRSQSIEKDLWIEHRSGIPTKLDTLLQPHMKRKKLISKLDNANDVIDPKVSKYCLVTQKLDSEGEVETNVYKADVNSTSCGGAEVVFNEVETLIISSPTSPRKSRSYTFQNFGSTPQN